MATNPMQKRARNSFLLGMLITVVIASIIIGLLFYQIIDLKRQEQEKVATTKKVLVLKNDIESGEKIDSSMFETKSADISTIPSDNITGADILENTVAKISLSKGTIVTKEMLAEDTIMAEDGTILKDLRIQEFNMIVLPSTLEIGDYIDIRLRLPSGQDYIVATKKKVVKTSDTSDSTIWLEITESELLTISNAIIEAYVMEGSLLYAITYTEPGLQEPATATYPVSGPVIELIRANPNILTSAKNELTARYNELQSERTSINTALGQYEMKRTDNIETKLKEQIQKQQQERKIYLNLLNQ